ncbi:MAG: ACT domain-containing protein, partial [Chloroflexota bacterium]
MQKRLVVTVTGSDRVGIVDEVTKVVLAHQGNVESSRMARLGGEFAMLMLISLPEGLLKELESGLGALRNQGLELTTRPTVYNFRQKFDGWVHYQINVRGADHEGIIHEITQYLAQEGVNIETMDTG